MRIAMVITSYHPVVGGAEKQVAQLSKLMADAGHEVHVLTRRWEGLSAEETIDGIPVRRIAAPGPKAAAAAGFVLGTARALRGLAPDVIHCHSLFSPSLAGCLGHALSGAPVIAKPMCGGEAASVAAKPFGSQRIAYFRRTLSRVIAVSSEIEMELKGLGFADDMIRRIPNGVDVERFSPAADAAEKAAIRQELGLPDGTLYLFAGRVARQKRLPELLEHWPSVLAQVPGATLLVAGANRKTSASATADGDRDAVPEHLLHQPGVKLLGHVSAMPAMYRAADVFVLPSAREGLSNAMLEACASGLPTIAAAIGGAEDVIRTGENGHLFETEDLDSMAEAMIAVGADAQLRARLGTAARQTVANRFDLRRTASGLLAEYAALSPSAGSSAQAA